MAELTDLSDLNKNVPVKHNESAPTTDAELAHKHVEHEAMKAARRAGEREHNDEKGSNEFTKVGPA